MYRCQFSWRRHSRVWRSNCRRKNRLLLTTTSSVSPHTLSHIHTHTVLHYMYILVDIKFRYIINYLYFIILICQNQPFVYLSGSFSISFGWVYSITLYVY